MSRIEKSFEIACEIYREHGVDPVKAMETLKPLLPAAVRSPETIPAEPEPRMNCVPTLIWY